MQANGHAAAPLPLPPEDADETTLRRGWEELLEASMECRDPGRQAAFLQAVQALLPRVAAAGISVKYGRKVLQRLEAVAPAREALRAALAARPRTAGLLEAALKLARPAACLLDAPLLQQAEVRVWGGEGKAYACSLYFVTCIR